MLFHCHRVQANFPGEKLGLVNRDQTRLVWDEHGGTFVLRLEGLEVVEAPEARRRGGGPAGGRPAGAASLAQQIEDFAGRHSLRLGQEAAVEVISETPILVACHIPGKQLFIYCEAPRLTVRLSGRQTMELRVAACSRPGGSRVRKRTWSSIWRWRPCAGCWRGCWPGPGEGHELGKGRGGVGG